MNDNNNGNDELNKPNFNEYNDNNDISKDSNSIGYLILGLLLPFIGFIIYIFLRRFKERASTKLFIGFFFGVLIRVLLYYLLIFVIL